MHAATRGLGKHATGEREQGLSARVVVGKRSNEKGKAIKNNVLNYTGAIQGRHLQGAASLASVRLGGEPGDCDTEEHEGSRENLGVGGRPRRGGCEKDEGIDGVEESKKRVFARRVVVED